MSNENTPENPDPQESGLSDLDPAETAETVEMAGSTEPTEILDSTEPAEALNEAVTDGLDDGVNDGIDENANVDDLSDILDPVDYADPIDPADPTDPFASTDDASGSSYVPPQPPPVPMAQPVRRLVRDPYARLGGVASGISHHYGIDVSLVRLGFILFTLFSGVGILLYILAWLIVPRAEFWPPAPPVKGQSLSASIQGRELAYGLLAVGILLAIFAGGGGAARMLISVGLVGAGVWMLVQPSSERASAPAVGGDPSPMAPVNPVDMTATTTPGNPADAAPTSWQPVSASEAADFGGPDDTMVSSFAAEGPTMSAGATTATASTSAGAGGPVYTSTQPVYVPNPVPPRRRRFWPVFLLIGLFLIPVLFIAGLITLVVFSEEGLNVDIDADNIREVRPLTLDDLPTSIDEGAGEILIDLTSVDLSTFEEGDSPRFIEIDLNAGEVNVEVPVGMAVNVDASVGAGDVTVFERYEDGIRPRINLSEEDAVVDLDIRVGVGEVSVGR